ncbi:MAG TPA: HAMP domain-containing protein, partial [Nitrospiria bacterium]|nr:HAMP domain-containing protein [Nitrospiria bacterium]
MTKKRKKSLQRRMVVSILLVGILSWIIGLISIYIFGKETIEQNIGANFQELASQTGKKIELIISHRLYEVKTLSSLELIKSAVEKANVKRGRYRIRSSNMKKARDEVVFVYLFKFTDKGIAEYLKGLMNNDPKEYLILTDEKGLLVASTKQIPKSDFSTDIWWNKAFNKKDIYVSDIYYDEILDDFALTMSSPIIIDGVPAGVLSITRSRDLLFKNVIQVKAGKTDHTMLASSDAKIIFCPIFPPGTHLLDKLAKAIFKDRPGWAITNADVHYPERNSINGFAPVGITLSEKTENFGGKRWYIFTSQDPAETYASISVLFKWVTLTGFFGTFALTVLGFYLTSRIINPIKELHKGMEVIGEGDLDYKLNIKTGDEIQDLSDGFNEMVDRVRGSYSTLEAHGKNIINSITNGIIVVNKVGIIVTWNKTMISRYALSSREIFGKKICDVFPNLCQMGLGENLKNLLGERTKEFHLRGIGHKMHEGGPKAILNIDGYALR